MKPRPTPEQRHAEAAAFFYENAGFSYHPATETEDEGKRRCAQEMADAEREAKERDLRFTWEIDPCTTSADWSDKKPAYEQWICLCSDGQFGETLACCGGIDLGRNGHPDTSDYTRVMQAELALEAIAVQDKRGGEA